MTGDLPLPDRRYTSTCSSTNHKDADRSWSTGQRNENFYYNTTSFEGRFIHFRKATRRKRGDFVLVECWREHER